MKSFFSRITMAIVFGLLTGIGLSSLSFNPEALAQFPNPDKEAKKRAREEEKRLKEEVEARRKEEAKRLKEEENRQKEEKRLEEEETRLKEKEERDRLREERERRKKEAKNGNGAPAGAPVRADGLDVAILMRDSRGTFSPVDPSREFVNGDQFRLEYNSRLNGIVYLVNVDPKGVATVIYRDEVSYGKKYVHPAPEENQVIQFRGSAGIEVLKIIISPKEIPDLENALRESGGKMGTNMRQARDELLGYVTPKQEPGDSCSGLELSVGGAKSSCRELSVVSLKQEQGKISVAVNPKGGGTGPNLFDSARLNNGEMAVLEIRLKHVQ